MIELAAAAAKSTSAWDEPGTLAFLVIFGMGVILYFVFRSLAKQLRKINEAARIEAAQPGPMQMAAGQSETSVADGWITGGGPVGSTQASAGRADTSRGEAVRADTLGGDSLQGDAVRGDAAQGLSGRGSLGQPPPR